MSRKEIEYEAQMYRKWREEQRREKEKFEALELAWYRRTYGYTNPTEVLAVFNGINSFARDHG